MKALILVDACNILHAVPEYRSRLGEGIDTLADELLERLRPLHDLEGWELHVIADGRGSRLDQQFRPPGKTLSLIFSPEGQQADAIIEAWLIKLGPDWTVRVATGDRAIINTALAESAEPVPPDDLLAWADRVSLRFSRQQATKPPDSFGNKLEGLS